MVDGNKNIRGGGVAKMTIAELIDGYFQFESVFSM
jgi:hypothetical protein